MHKALLRESVDRVSVIVSSMCPSPPQFSAGSLHNAVGEQGDSPPLTESLTELSRIIVLCHFLVL